MKKLKEEFTRSGFDFELVRRDGKKAIYAKYNGDILIAYEVFRIKTRQTRYSHLLEREYPASEIYPANEDFGRIAWTFISYERAILKYNSL